MKSKIRIASVFVFTFVSSVSFAQYKFDIGLKASTYEMERFQFDARFHLDNPYTLVANFSHGSRSSYYTGQTPIYNDSLIDVDSRYFNVSNNTLKIGVQRKLGFFATDVFYVGAVLGVGIENQLFSTYEDTYVVYDTLITPTYLISHNLSDGENFTKTTARSINTQAALSFGMDVPLSKRFSINAELGFATIFSKSEVHSTFFDGFYPSISGGLRYAFGKRAE